MSTIHFKTSGGDRFKVSHYASGIIKKQIEAREILLTKKNTLSYGIDRGGSGRKFILDIHSEQSRNNIRDRVYPWEITAPGMKPIVGGELNDVVVSLNVHGYGEEIFPLNMTSLINRAERMWLLHDMSQNNRKDITLDDTLNFYNNQIIISLPANPQKTSVPINAATFFVGERVNPQSQNRFMGMLLFSHFNFSADLDCLNQENLMLLSVGKRNGAFKEVAIYGDKENASFKEYADFIDLTNINLVNSASIPMELEV
jgi:hypothetical protein